VPPKSIVLGDGDARAICAETRAPRTPPEPGANNEKIEIEFVRHHFRPAHAPRQGRQHQGRSHIDEQPMSRRRE